MATPEELAQLAAQAAAAKAAAAQAAAEAAQAAYEAALAASATAPASATTSAGPSEAAPPASGATPASATPTVAAPASEPSTGYAAEVAAGYSTDGAIPVGVYMENGSPMPHVPVTLPLAMLNRHGLVAGATGTGKTRTLQLLAEGLSNAGVPVFLTDIKGDLTGMAEPGESNEKLLARTAAQGQHWQPISFPTEFFALGGQGAGIPIRTSVSDFGPLLLAKVLELNETQESALSLIFHWADQQQLGLADLGDLRSVVSYLTGDSGKAELEGIGGVAPATAGVILRQISALQAQGADEFFGEPGFDVRDFIRTHTSADGVNRGVLNIVELPDLASQPALFSTFIMWLLAELFEVMPEVGDREKPELVFFFDEAHLLFNGATPAFLDAIVRTVRLIRSKGVGIMFVTQTPKDIPDAVLAQLGAKVQHALRAHTPNDQKALRSTVKTFPTSPLDLEKVLPALGTGEAIVTVLDKKGRPSPVAPTRIWAPASVMGSAMHTDISAVAKASSLYARYGEKVDPESATELLAQRVAAEQEAAKAAATQAAAEAAAKAEQDRLAKELEKQLAAEKKQAEREAEKARAAAEKAAAQAQLQAEREAERQAKRRERVVDNVVNSVARTIGNSIVRSIFGNRRR
ncbi:MAG: helicase HerA-like domain-containing protein [Arcanobacterium sp.]|nr:helicase HerA-like domain-containing protein [Arcanobacterium sp.]